jgi:hypothetical protein
MANLSIINDSTMTCTVQQVLYDRECKLKVHSFFYIFSQEMSVPDGCILSVTLRRMLECSAW